LGATLKRVTDGMTVEDIIEEYPNITKEKVKVAMGYTEKIAGGEDIIPTVKGEHEVSSGRE
jgi:uncharacterized protein (DUF433 family)